MKRGIGAYCRERMLVIKGLSIWSFVPFRLGFCLDRFARVLEKKAQRLFRLHVGSDTAKRPVLFKTHLNRCERLSPLPRDPFHFPVYLVPRGANPFALGNPSEQQRSFYVSDRLSALLLLHLFPIDLELPWIHSFGCHGAQAVFHAITDLPLDKGFRYGEFMGIDDLVEDPVLGGALGFLLAL